MVDSVQEGVYPWRSLDRWDRTSKLCGNCRFWPLSGWGQDNWDRGTPSYPDPAGADNYVSDCRRHAPRAPNETRVVGYTAVWPRTNVGQSCGDFEPRP
jgi:hypothetical protein